MEIVLSDEKEQGFTTERTIEKGELEMQVEERIIESIKMYSRSDDSCMQRGDKGKNKTWKGYQKLDDTITKNDHQE